MRATPPVPTLVEPPHAAKSRPRAEVLMRLVQPVAGALVRLLAPTRIDPQTIVWSHAAIGLGAAAAVVHGGASALLLAAVLLQVRTVLDNVDGGLARATGRVSQLGRYLDSVLDTLVNAVLFVALALHAPGPWAWPLAALAFVVLMLVLTLDYNLERRYKAVRSTGPEVDEAPIGGPRGLFELVRDVYDRVLAPQDELVTRIDDALFDLARRRSGGGPIELEHRLAWSDLYSSATLVNLGLSTQMLVLGVCLVLGAPFAYVPIVLAQGIYVVVVQVVRVERFVRYRRAT